MKYNKGVRFRKTVITSHEKTSSNSEICSMSNIDKIGKIDNICPDKNSENMNSDLYNLNDINNINDTFINKYNSLFSNIHSNSNISNTFSKTNYGNGFTLKHTKLKEKTLTLTSFLNSLKKEIKNPTDITNITNYLCQYFEFFKLNIVNINHITRILRYEEVEANKTIILNGEMIDKIYFLIDGKVSLHKTYPIKKKMTFNDYKNYLHQINKVEKNKYKLQRIINENKINDIDINVNELNQLEYYFNLLKPSKQKEIFILEEEKKLTEYLFGYTFGKINLEDNAIYISDSCIKSVLPSKLLSISKEEYKKLLEEIKKNSNIFNSFELEDFTKFTSKNNILSTWDLFYYNNFLQLLEKMTLNKDDYLFKQEDPSDYLYFLVEGKIEINTIIDKDRESFFKYIIDDSSNILYLIENGEISTVKDLIKVIKVNNTLKMFTSKTKVMDEAIDKKDLMISSKLDSKTQINNDLKTPNSSTKLILECMKICNVAEDNNVEGSLINNEDKDSANNKFNQNNKVNFINSVSYINSLPEIIGITDCIDRKNRICSVKIISSKAIFYKIKLIDFIYLLPKDKNNFIKFKKYFILQKNRFLRKLKEPNLKGYIDSNFDLQIKNMNYLKFLKLKNKNLESDPYQTFHKQSYSLFNENKTNDLDSENNFDISFTNPLLKTMYGTGINSKLSSDYIIKPIYKRARNEEAKLTEKTTYTKIKKSMYQNNPSFSKKKMNFSINNCNNENHIKLNKMIINSNIKVINPYNYNNDFNKRKCLSIEPKKFLRIINNNQEKNDGYFDKEELQGFSREDEEMRFRSTSNDNFRKGNKQSYNLYNGKGMGKNKSMQLASGLMPIKSNWNFKDCNRTKWFGNENHLARERRNQWLECRSMGRYPSMNNMLNGSRTNLNNKFFNMKKNIKK